VRLVGVMFSVKLDGLLRVYPIQAESVSNTMESPMRFLEMTILAFVFVALAVALRLLPHPFHFTPVAASLLFFGARVDRKWMWSPVAALVASDVYLTLVRY